MVGRIGSAAALVVAVVLFFAVNILSDGIFRLARLDLTESKLYTLSQGTRNIIASLDEPVTVRFFYSGALANKAPQVRTYAERVRDLLEEYAALSNGKIRLEVIDPEPFSEEEDRAVGFGLQGVRLTATGDTFYFGLAGTNTVDDTQVIPFFSLEKERFLEYDLTKLVYGLSNPKKPVVGLISDLPLEYGPGGIQMAMRGQSEPYAVMTAMEQFFTVRSLGTELAEIEDEVDILLLVHPRGLSEATLYAVDQFVLRGGRAMVFVDPYSETGRAIPPAPGMPPNPADDHSSNLEPLFAAWGIEMEAGKVVGDTTYATRVNAGATASMQVVDYPAWLSLRGDAIARDDVVTSDLNLLIMASAGSFKSAEGATTTLTPIVASSKNAMLIDAAIVRGQPDPSAMLAEFESADQSFVLAGRVSGNVKSAFDGPPAKEAKEAAEESTANEEDKPAKPHLAESTAPINVIVVGDADMLDDRFWLRRQSLLGQQFVVPTSGNGDFLINALDNLSGNSDLISLRSRGLSSRPFEVIEDIRREAERMFLTREKELQDKLRDTEAKLAEVQSKQTEGSTAILSEEEAKTIAAFREDMIATRRELRRVQHSMRKDIETLESWLKFVNIGLVPLIVLVLALVLGMARYRRRAAAVRQA